MFQFKEKVHERIVFIKNDDDNDNDDGCGDDEDNNIVTAIMIMI